jgi:hypothetical protein
MSTSRKQALAALLTFFIPMAAAATSNRIFVSTTGNDANDCSNPLTPCIDFAGALSQVNAGGEIIAEATGPYGPLNITKAVTISGPPGVVIYSGHQVTVNAPGATVVLRGLTIDGSGATENGIEVDAIGSLHVESCVIANFAGSSSSQGNGIHMASAGNLFVKDTEVRGNGFVEIWVSPPSGTAKASIDHCRIEKGQMGLLTNPGGVTQVRDSVVSGNVNGGFEALNGGELNIDTCVATDNGSGVVSDGTGSLVRLSNSVVTDNLTGVLFVNSGSLLSRGDNTVEGNATDGTFSGTYSAK